MGWMKGSCKGKDVWVEVDAGGKPVVSAGRVPVRYSNKDGARIYRAGARNVELTGAAVEQLPDGVSADDKPAKAGSTKGGRKSRGSGFGSAGTRTKAQAQAAAAFAGELIANFSSDAAVCFTDGACKGNPGPAGAGAVVRLPDGTRMEAHRALGRATNNVGELTAIGLACELLDQAGFDPTAPVEILTDSKYCHGLLSLGWKGKANRELIDGVKAQLAQRRHRIHWIAGHVGIAENERADALANLGVDESLRRR